LKQGKALSSFLSAFGLACAVMKAQEQQERLKMNWKHLLLTRGNDTNFLENHTSTIKRETEDAIDAKMEVSLEENMENIMYVLMSRHLNAGQNRNVKMTNRLFENVAKLKSLERR
jgi:hypothetical protein